MSNDPQAKLVNHYIEEYLDSKGQTWENVSSLPEPEARQLLSEASTYASLKLTEIEDKASVIHELHNAMSLK